MAWRFVGPIARDCRNGPSQPILVVMSPLGCSISEKGWPTAAGVCLASVLALAFPASGRSAVTTFGSSLSVPATLNTAENLTYPGINTAVPPAPDAPNGYVHTYHFGADSAQWNVGLAAGQSSSPATGQALKVRLEGCAVAAPGGPPPLTEIHFQDLSPLPGGGAQVNLTSQGFEIPVCGHNGASDTTVSTYEPVNLCVAQGDYVAFNDDGGFVQPSYRSGVPYRVLGAVTGSTSDSFIRGGGTGNGASFLPGDTSAMDGFATNHGDELMLQVVLGTGRDATHICAGGTKGAPPKLAPIRVSPQTDGVNSKSIVAVALYCRVSPQCNGVATLTLQDQHTYGRTGFTLPPNRTSHVPIRVSSKLLRMIRRNHGVSAKLTAVVGSATVTQNVGVKIF